MQRVPVVILQLRPVAIRNAIVAKQNLLPHDPLPFGCSRLCPPKTPSKVFTLSCSVLGYNDFIKNDLVRLARRPARRTKRGT